MSRSVRPITALFTSAALLLVACSGDETVATEVSSESTQPPQTDAPTTTAAALAAATFSVRPGPEQVTILDAEPGTELTVVGPDGPVASGTVDEQGSLLFRDIEPGGDYVVVSDDESSEPFAVSSPDDHPSAEFYQAQDGLPAGGFGYITARDGTTLSAHVVLPGPADGGPYPTVVEYSGYSPSNPGDTTFAQIYNTLGFAYVGVNMRGTGCSGGSFRYFETVQSLDGYDVIETVAAQPWVLDNEVGMVGISYPGISQLFVAAQQPPSLAAITPLSVLDDSYRSTLYPGGILNTGFAVEWTEERMRSAEVFGQSWSKDRVDAGDTECAANQKVRLQNPDLLEEIRATPFYDAELGDSLAPDTFVDRIDVPVFIAGAWQDEQTGGRFPAMLDRFTGSPDVDVMLVNGVHTESLSPPILGRYAQFLQLYVAKKTPDLAALDVIAPILSSTLYGLPEAATFENRLAGLPYDEALAAFQSDPAIQVLVEQGGAPDLPGGAAAPHFVLSFPAWPIPATEATNWFLGDGGTLSADAGMPGESSYTADPKALPATYWAGDSSAIWRADAVYDWRPLADGTGVGFTSEPLSADTMMVGPGSVDLWITSSAGDTDIEVTISEVRADGTEVYVQSGWLRASRRTLDSARSSDLRPVHTHLEADAAELPAGVATLARIELFPFAHPFRAGSRIRLTVDAPGNNRPVWEFDTIAAGETVTVVHDAEHPSRVVLPLIPGIEIPDRVVACGALRAQPCRRWIAAANGG
jgi:predicted acyl esterase